MFQTARTGLVLLLFFQVSELLGTRNIHIASSGVVIGPNGVAPEEIENLGHKGL